MGEIKASFADKRIIKSIIPVLGLLLWAISAFIGLFGWDDFIFVIIFSILIAIGCLIPAIIALVVYTVLASKKELAVSEYGIRGKMLSGKAFSLTADMVQQVEPYGINGIKIIDRNRMTYKFSCVDNRDYICLAMSNLGIAVNPNLVQDQNAVVMSETDRKKKKILPIVSLAIAVLGNIFMSVSSIWFNSDGNYYYRTYTYNYYNAQYDFYLPVEDGYWTHLYYGYEMFTTYLAIIAWIAAIIVIAVYIPQINHRLSVSADKVRGVNGFGKVTITPISQITNVLSKASDSSVSVFCSGIKRKYCMIANHMQIVQTINSFRPNAYMPMQGYAAQPTAPVQPAYAPPVQSTAPVLPTYAPPAQPTAPAQPYAPAAPSVEYAQTYAPQTQPAAPANSTPDVADEIKSLKELLDMGAITQEEFDAKKKQILGL